MTDLGEMGGVPPVPCRQALFVKKYKEPGVRVSSANFLMGWAIKGMTNEGKKDDKSNVNEGKK